MFPVRCFYSKICIFLARCTHVRVPRTGAQVYVRVIAWDRFVQGTLVINRRSQRGLAPMHLAASVGNADMLQALLEAGCGAPTSECAVVCVNVSGHPCVACFLIRGPRAC